MAFVRRARARAPYRKRTVRKTYSQKKTMSNTALTKKVQKLSKIVKPLEKNILYYQISRSGAIGNTTGNNPYSTPLWNYSTWSRTFGTDADDETRHTALMKYFKFWATLESNGERANINYSVFVVTLKKQGWDRISTIDGTLLPLTPGTHYFNGTNVGQGVVLNPNFFNIHYARKFFTGTVGSTATDMKDLRIPFSYKHKYNVLFKNPTGDWKANSFSRVPGQNMYLMIFNNDSTADSSVQLNLSGYVQLEST